MSLLPDFGDPELVHSIEALSSEEIDRLPFGAVHLGPDHRVQFYSAVERTQSGSGALPRVGLDWFAEIAPCMGTPHYRERLQRGLAGGTVDLHFNHIGDFSDCNREMEVRIRSASDGGMWVFIRR